MPTEAPTSSTTTTTAVSYEVPAVIDAAYVEKVMAALDHVLGDAIRLMVRERGLSETFLDHLAAIYTEKELEFHQGLWAESFRQTLDERPPVPGDPLTRVQRVLRADRECVVVAVDRSFAATLTVPERKPPQQRYIALVPAVREQDRRGLNPTPWMMSFDGWMQDGGEPDAPCAGNDRD